ncbi:hypothetical protein FZC66_07195 [Priestia megaterium]|nr:hypothetical protein FZC66_07195 [Priestia megaterium]
MGVWYFTIAAVIAVIGMMFIYQSTLHTIDQKLTQDKKDEDIYKELIQVQTAFFIKHAALEFIPIILVVLAFTEAENAQSTFSMNPLIIVAVVWIGASLRVYQLYKQLASRINKPQFKTFLSRFMMIELALMAAFPIIAFVGALATVG